jgi:YjbE family integral membrane protein
MSASGLDISQYGLAEISDILQIIFADIILSGDNALVIGMAAAGLAAAQRKRAIAIGMAMAAILRILFAIVAAQLLAIKGILLIGGGLLAWVCYRFYHDLKEFNRINDQALAGGEAGPASGEKLVEKSFGRALLTILVADVSMSIDNIVAVAAIARDNTALLVFGLGLAIAFMAFSASLIMKIMIKYRWLSYFGFWFLIYLTCTMLYDGLLDLNLIAAVF